MRRAALLLPLLLAAAARAEGVETIHRYAIDKQTQLLNYVFTDTLVIASIRYAVDAPVINNKTGPAEPPKIAHALVAFDRATEKVLWRKDNLPEAYHLALAGDSLALAYDDGTLKAKRGLLLIDTATGKVKAESNLEGRPLTLQYFPKSKTHTMLLYPQARMDAINDKTTVEVQGFDSKAQFAWKSSFKADGILLLGHNDKTLAVETIGNLGKSAWAGLDAATGKLLWQRQAIKELPAAEFPASADPLDPSAHAIVILNTARACGFLRLADGKLVHAMPTPGQIQCWPVALPEGRVLFRYTDAHQKTRMDCEKTATGKVLWDVKAPDESVIAPVPWGDKIAVTLRHTGEALGGYQTQMTDVQIYTATGELLGTVAGEKTLDINDTLPPQPAGETLFVSGMKDLLELRIKKP